MQSSSYARNGIDQEAVDKKAVDKKAVDAMLTASRALVAVATQSLGAAAEETTIAQYRALVVLASRGPQRLTDLACALGVAPSTAGRMCDRLVRKGLIRRHRARTDRRAVLVSITAPGRDVVDQATARRRELIAGILANMPRDKQREVAAAFSCSRSWSAWALGSAPWRSATSSTSSPGWRQGTPSSGRTGACPAATCRGSAWPATWSFLSSAGCSTGR